MPLSSLFAAIGRMFGKSGAEPAPIAAVPTLSISPSSASTAVTSPTWIDFCEPLTQASEGCVLKAYPDPASGGVPYTCGWGSTGPDVTATTVWSQQEADNRLRVDLVGLVFIGVADVVAFGLLLAPGEEWHGEQAQGKGATHGNSTRLWEHSEPEKREVTGKR